MSGRIPRGAVRNTILIMSVTTLLPVALHAANRNAPAGKEETKSPATPVNQVKTPATRGPASLTRQTPLGEAIDLLRNSTTPPLKIIVLWKPLAEAGIYRDTPIGIDGSAGLSAKQYLELLVLSLSAGASTRLGYTVDKGVITLATTDALPVPKPITRIYDISDLVAPPARYSLSSMGFTAGYGGPPGYPSFQSYAVNQGANLASSATGVYRRTGPTSRSYRSR